MRKTVVATAILIAQWHTTALAQTPHSPEPMVRTVEVENGVQLQVLDWGDSGRPVVLLSGLGDDAHIFDAFAPKLATTFHVYAISRRGRGASSHPSPTVDNYTPERLGQDVLAAIRALHLSRPVLVGHSISGEELSYIGSQHPDAVAGLVYMEAAYPYALYDQVHGNLGLDAIAVRQDLLPFTDGYDYEPIQNDERLIADLHRLEKEIRQHEKETKGLPPTPVSPRMTPDLFAIMQERERFTSVHVPSLVLFALDTQPAKAGDATSGPAAVRQRLMLRDKRQQIAAVKREMPSAKIVLIPHASHSIFQSNEADVVQAIKTFVTKLP